MFAPKAVYPNVHSIPIVFDADDPREAALLRTFMRSFGEEYAQSEDLAPPRYHCLTLLPGGLRKPLQRPQQFKAEGGSES